MNRERKTPDALAAHRAALRKLLDGAAIASGDLKGLKALLRRFLLNRELRPEDLCVSDLEALLFCVFLVKKNYPLPQGLEWSPASLEALRSTQIKKRSEQNYKVILKRFFKKLIKNFNAQRGLSGGDDLEFYRAHFAEAASQSGEDWRLLRYGNVFNENAAPGLGQRKSKRTFAKVLRQSESFMRQLRAYLENRLELAGEAHGIHLDYAPILESKVELLAAKWGAKLYSNKNLKARVCKFVQDLVRNNKVKLPWGFAELDQGVRNVRRLFREA